MNTLNKLLTITPLAVVLAATATFASARGIGDMRTGNMGYRLGCSVHELADTGFHCQEYQETHDLIDQHMSPDYWPNDNGFDNQFMPQEFNNIGGGGGGGGGGGRGLYLSPTDTYE